MALPSIPVNRIVNINPAVIGTGGNPLALNTVAIASQDATRTFGVREFGTVDEVQNYYGINSLTAKWAAGYFAGFDGSTKKPSTLYIAQQHIKPVEAALQGGSLKSMTLEQLKAVKGKLATVVDGNVKETEIDLKDATSFGDAAFTMAGLTGVNMEFDANLQCFVISSETGDKGLVAYCHGDVAQKLKLDEEGGAKIEGYRASETIADLMKIVTGQTLNWALFAHIEAQERDVREEAAAWATQQNGRFGYIDVSLEPAALIADNPSCFGSWLKETEQNGTMALYGTPDKGAMVCGTVASIDFKRTNGRTNIMFRGQAGLKADVTSNEDYTALTRNGYSFYGAFATANDRFQFIVNGAVSGPFKWLDNYVNQIYLNAQLQLAMITMLTSYPSIPYNADGEAIHRAAAQDPINEGINFGGIRTLDDRNALSEQQKSIINTQAGFDAVPQLLSKGYVLVIGSVDAQTRGLRGSYPLTLFYTDGGSVQAVNLASVNVQ